MDKKFVARDISQTGKYAVMFVIPSRVRTGYVSTQTQSLHSTSKAADKAAIKLATENNLDAYYYDNTLELMHPKKFRVGKLL